MEGKELLAIRNDIQAQPVEVDEQFILQQSLEQ